MDTKETKTTTTSTNPVAGTSTKVTERTLQGSADAPDVVVIEKTGGKKKRGKRRYSNRLKEAQQILFPLNRAAERVSDAVAAGITVWRRESDKSSRRKRDGAVKDLTDNGARSVAKIVRKSSLAPLDVSKAMRRTRLYRSIVRSIRF